MSGSGAGADTGIILRPLRPQDLDCVAALWRGAWCSANRAIPEAEVAPLPHWQARAQAEFLPPAEAWLLRGVEDGPGDLRAFMVMETARACVTQLHVAPHWQGQGLGPRLLALARERMPAGWFLQAAQANVGAQRFYRRQGLQEGPRDRNPGNGRWRVRWSWAPGP